MTPKDPPVQPQPTNPPTVTQQEATANAQAAQARAQNTSRFPFPDDQRAVAEQQAAADALAREQRAAGTVFSTGVAADQQRTATAQPVSNANAPERNWRGPNMGVLSQWQVADYYALAAARDASMGTGDRTSAQAFKVEPPLTMREIESYFNYGNLAENLHNLAKEFWDVSVALAALPVSTESNVAIRKLLESRDAAVRAAQPLPVLMPGPLVPTP